MAIRGDLMSKEKKLKLLGWGAPKGSGKTTFYITQPGTTLVFQYDLGSTTIPPGVDPANIYVQTYPDAGVADKDVSNIINSDKWKRGKEVYQAVMTDILAITSAFRENKDEIKLFDGSIVPKPDNLILDGGVRLDQIILDGFCAINNITDPGDALDSKGKIGGGTIKFYGKRLASLTKAFTWAISLPINVAFITWEDVKVQYDTHSGSVTVLSKEPDIGGRLNTWGPGLFDASLYHYSDSGKFYVRTKPTNIIQRVGVRDNYTLADIIDVTIDPKSGDKRLPFARVFPDRG